MASQTTYGSPFGTRVLVVTLLAFLPPAAANTYFTEEPGSCQIIGDVDVYGMSPISKIFQWLIDNVVGIGIRLGYYLQYASVVLCVISNRLDDLKAARNGFNAFSIALLINLYRNASTDLAIEWYLVFLLAVVLPIGATFSVTSDEDRKNSSLSMIVQVVLQIMFLFSTPYLFFASLENGRKANCQIKAFLFAEIDLYQHGWQIAGKVFSVFAVALGVLQCGVVASLVSLVWKDLEDERQHNQDEATAEVRDHLGTTQSNTSADQRRQSLRMGFMRRKRMWLMLSAMAVTQGVFAIGFIEKTIQVNSLDMSAGPITAAGQLIPLVIGAYVLFISVMGLLKKPCIRLVRWALRQKSLMGAMKSSRKSLCTMYLQMMQSIKSRLLFRKTEAERSSQGHRLPEPTQGGSLQEIREDRENDIELERQSCKSAEGADDKDVQEPGE
jgi:hypothetical protein